MYKVTCDGKTLHNDELQQLKISGGKVTLEIGKSGLFEFTIYPDHPYYENVKPVVSIIEVYRNEAVIFRGRALNIKYGFFNEKQVSCEGELAFLIDSIIEPHAYYGSFIEYFEYIIDIHNGQVEEAKRFERGSVTVAEFYPYEVVEDFNFNTSYDTINQRMVEESGGYLQVRHEYGTMYLDLLNYDMNISNVSEQTITLGKNLIDIKRDVEGSEVFSGIVPLGAKIGETENRLDISSVNGGSYSITNADAVAVYGKIFKVVIFENITNATTLLSEARKYLAESYGAVNTIEITAADLSGMNPDLDSFQIGQWVKVESEQHFNSGQQTFLIRKMTINLSNPAATKIEIGKTKQGLTDNLGNYTDDIGSVLNSISKVSGSIGSISAKADTAVQTATTAQQTANTAKTTADTASKTATTAQTTATTAKSTADTAKSTADTAKSTADTAKTTASTAVTTANSANTTAKAAQTTANNVASRVTVLEKVQPYVIETGTTGIFKWQKFSDNTCEFFGKIPVTNYDITTALGTWYRGANLYEATAYAYPFSMTEAPAVEMTFQTRNGLAAIAWIFSADANTAQSYLPQCYLIRPVTGKGIYGNINIIGKGKLS